MAGRDTNKNLNLFENKAIRNCKFVAKICPSPCVRVPVPQLHGSHLHPDNQRSEKIHASYLRSQPPVSCPLG